MILLLLYMVYEGRPSPGNFFVCVVFVSLYLVLVAVFLTVMLYTALVSVVARYL